MMRWDVINKFIEKRNYTSYLEIGYYKGWSFDQVKCADKIAVDPFPCKTPIQEKWGDNTSNNTEGGLIIKTTSDAFFENTHSKWDIIFIDGLHEWRQVHRDIINSLRVLKEGGVIILHDCNPPTLKHTTTGVDGAWTGDTYKAVLHFQFNHPSYYYYTIDTDWGLGVIDTVKKRDLPFLDPGYSFGVNSWDFFNQNRKILLNLQDVKSINIV